jgi:putative Mn2+ efflux pump MntP
VVGLLLVAVALGLSNFAAAIAIGLSGVDAALRLRVAIVFGAFEAAMPLCGLLLGVRAAHTLGSATSYVGGGLLVATGVYATWQARRRPSGDRSGRSAHLTPLVVTGAALSIDNLVVGFALGTHRVPLALAAAVIAVVSVGMSLLGLELGGRLGEAVERWSEELGGAVLILVGVAIAIGLL